MMVVYHANWLIIVAKEIGKIDSVRRIGRIGVESPFNISNTAASAIVTTVRDQWHECFTHNIWHQQRDSVRLAMQKCRFENLEKVPFCSGVHDGIVDKHTIELSFQPDVS